MMQDMMTMMNDSSLFEGAQGINIGPNGPKNILGQNFNQEYTSKRLYPPTLHYDEYLIDVSVDGDLAYGGTIEKGDGVKDLKINLKC